MIQGAKLLFLLSLLCLALIACNSATAPTPQPSVTTAIDLPEPKATESPPTVIVPLTATPTPVLTKEPEQTTTPEPQQTAVSTAITEPTGNPVPTPTLQLSPSQTATPQFPFSPDKLGMTEQQVQESTETAHQLCVSIKPFLYNNIALGSTTFAEYKEDLAEAIIRNMTEESDSEFIPSELEGKNYVIWLFHLCGITEAEAADHELPDTPALPYEHFDSFPLSSHPDFAFMSTADLHQYLADLLLRCDFAQESVDSLGLDDAKAAFSRGILLDNPESTLTSSEIQEFIDWILMACGIE